MAMNTSTKPVPSHPGYGHRHRTPVAIQRGADDEFRTIGVYVGDPRFDDPAIWKCEQNTLLERLGGYDYEGEGRDAEMNSAGTKIYLDGEGEQAILGLYVGQYHWLGYLEGLPLRQFLTSSLASLLGQRKREAVAILGDPSGPNGMYPFRPVGIELCCSGGDQAGLKVCLGFHCIGVLRNPALQLFLDRALTRTIVGIDPKYLLKPKPRPKPPSTNNVVSIADAQAKAPGIGPYGEEANRAG